MRNHAYRETHSSEKRLHAGESTQSFHELWLKEKGRVKAEIILHKDGSFNEAASSRRTAIANSHSHRFPKSAVAVRQLRSQCHDPVVFLFVHRPSKGGPFGARPWSRGTPRMVLMVMITPKLTNFVGILS